MAHQASIIQELFLGNMISNFLYSMMIILDLISILENGIQSGYTGLKPFLDFFNKKKDEITNDSTSNQNIKEGDV